MSSVDWVGTSRWTPRPPGPVMLDPLVLSLLSFLSGHYAALSMDWGRGHKQWDTSRDASIVTRTGGGDGPVSLWTWQCRWSRQAWVQASPPKVRRAAGLRFWTPPEPLQVIWAAHPGQLLATSSVASSASAMPSMDPLPRQIFTVRSLSITQTRDVTVLRIVDGDREVPEKWGLITWFLQKIPALFIKGLLV